MHNSFPAGLPARQGLYDPRFEHDACGVSFVADIKGRASRSIVAMGIGALENWLHGSTPGGAIEAAADYRQEDQTQAEIDEDRAAGA